jgi:hypothetical protein
VRRWLGLTPLVLALGCSGLDEGEAGVVALQVQVPTLTSLEVGEQVQLSVVALDADGNVVEAPVSWRTPDATLTVDGSGLVTGTSAGSGRVQAFSGSLSSDLLTFTVLTAADTLVIIGDSVLTVPADPGTTAPLVVQLRSFNPADPVASRPVIYEIIAPPAGDAPVVALTGGVQIDTLTTAADGTVSTVALSRISGTPAPASATVEVRAFRTRGAAVRGSGQHFTVFFQ